MNEAEFQARRAHGIDSFTARITCMCGRQFAAPTTAEAFGALWDHLDTEGLPILADPTDDEPVPYLPIPAEGACIRDGWPDTDEGADE